MIQAQRRAGLHVQRWGPFHQPWRELRTGTHCWTTREPTYAGIGAWPLTPSAAPSSHCLPSCLFSCPACLHHPLLALGCRSTPTSQLRDHGGRLLFLLSCPRSCSPGTLSDLSPLLRAQPCPAPSPLPGTLTPACDTDKHKHSISGHFFLFVFTSVTKDQGQLLLPGSQSLETVVSKPTSRALTQPLPGWGGHPSTQFLCRVH